MQRERVKKKSDRRKSKEHRVANLGHSKQVLSTAYKRSMKKMIDCQLLVKLVQKTGGPSKNGSLITVFLIHNRNINHSHHLTHPDPHSRQHPPLERVIIIHNSAK